VEAAFLSTSQVSSLYCLILKRRWADAECIRQELDVTKENKRKVLGDAVYLIRFPLMPVEEFAQGPAQSGMISDREVIELFLYYTLNPKPRVRTCVFCFCLQTLACKIGLQQRDLPRSGRVLFLVNFGFQSICISQEVIVLVK